MTKMNIEIMNSKVKERRGKESERFELDDL